MRNHRQRPGARCRLPDILGGLRDRHGAPAGFCPHRHELPREFADEVTAGNPGRELETLARRVGVVDGDADLVEMRVRVERDDSVMRGQRRRTIRSGRNQKGTCGKESGAPNTNRTCDLSLRRGLLYPLSYRGEAASRLRGGEIRARAG